MSGAASLWCSTFFSHHCHYYSRVYSGISLVIAASYKGVKLYAPALFCTKNGCFSIEFCEEITSAEEVKFICKQKERIARRYIIFRVKQEVKIMAALAIHTNNGINHGEMESHRFHEDRNSLGRKILKYLEGCFRFYGEMMYGRPVYDRYEEVRYEK